MSVFSNEHLDKLAFILYDRPAGRNVIGYAIEKIEQLRADNERLREAMTDMLGGWRYIRETYGDLAGVGWDRVESKAQEALEGKP